MRRPRFLRSLLQPHYIYRPSQFIRRIYREWIRSTPPLETAILPWGHSLQVAPTEHIGRAVWLHGIYGTTVCEILWRLSEPEMVHLDVGANIGVVTSLLAHRALDGRVYSFEPHPGLYNRLAKNVRRFRRQGRADLYPFPFALHSRSGTVHLTWNREFLHNHGLASLSESPSGHALKVPCSTLDFLFPSTHINILKIDVEGWESQVVAGAEALLSESRIDHILYECHEGPHASLHDRFSHHGYTCFALGSSISGPRLFPLNDLSVPVPELNSSFLATRFPSRVTTLVGPDGWRCLTSTR